MAKFIWAELPFGSISIEPDYAQSGTTFAIPMNKLSVHWVMFFKMIMMILRQAELPGLWNMEIWASPQKME